MKILLSLVTASLLVVLFALLLFCGYVLYMNCFSSGFLYYDGLIGLGTSFVVLLFACIFFCRFRRKKRIEQSIKEMFLSLLAATFLVYSFHITFPTVMNRSLSLYILSRIDTADGQSFEEVQEGFMDGYINNYSTVCRRLDEQLSSGNVYFNEGRYAISKKGKRILSILQAIAAVTGQDPYYVQRTKRRNPPLSYTVEDGRCIRVE